MRVPTGLVLVLGLLLLGACGGRAYSFEPHPAEATPPGPGILSGKQGKITVYEQ